MSPPRTTKLSVIHWPDTTLPIPRVSVWDATPHPRRATGAGRDRLVLLTMPAHGRAVSLPDETYLRQLAELDLADDEAILRFANAFGWLGAGDGPDVGFDDLDAGVLSPSVGFILRLGEERSQATAPKPRAFHQIRHLDEFVLYASVLRDMTRIWQALTGALGWDVVFAKWETRRDWYDGLPDPVPTQESVLRATEFLEELLNKALKPFQVHIEVVQPGAPLAKKHEARWYATPYQALCLQLANHIAERTEYRRCANTACARLFVRQQGRAAKGQNWKVGVKYCSKACAWAQSQRNRRAKKASAPRGLTETNTK